MRTAPLKRKTPMPRSDFKSAAGLLRVAAAQAKGHVREPRVRKALKSHRPKSTPIRASARGQECTLRFPGICNRNPETTVWAHSNNYVDGKCAGKKARDEEGCYACFACHAFYDGGYAGSEWSRGMIEDRFNSARSASQEILTQKGLMPCR